MDCKGKSKGNDNNDCTIKVENRYQKKGGKVIQLTIIDSLSEAPSHLILRVLGVLHLHTWNVWIYRELLISSFPNAKQETTPVLEIGRIMHYFLH